eukprot:COSAG05_NODE_808_length_7189_cov_16.336530_6_plen_194_part_00
MVGSQQEALRVGCGDWRRFVCGSGPPAIPCVPFAVTLLGLVGAAVAWLATQEQLPYLPLRLTGDDALFSASPFQLLGIGTWAIQSRLWAQAERELASATSGGGAGNFTASTRLARSGQYGFCRNPLYLATLIFFFPSISLLTNSAWFALVGSSLQMLNYNLLVIRAEEALLKAKFGEDWDAYREQVGRWCPWC